ncbi:YbjQ family protein [Moraxella sp. Tifton1]|nr:heavy metal-binding domain-containing protein [Moraxella sp. Tifton1]MCL1622978.1 YbjQ family protein [Moraxella sp. Tifton1]
MDFIELLLKNIQITISVILLIIGWCFGRVNERKHLVKLDADEQSLTHIIVSNERLYMPKVLGDGVLVMGGVCVAQDRFKLISAIFLSFFGKNLTVYESLLERSRREAVIRMKRQASELGYDHIYGVRIETSMVDGGGVEVLAYGTAVRC